MNLGHCMKISIGSKIFTGPWGGGNLFAKNLTNYLINLGHDVIHDLYDDDIDLILLTDPRKSSYSSNYDHIDIHRYKKFINNDVKVVHRINECDERKNTIGQNEFFIDANSCADTTVFVSNWLMKLYYDKGLDNNNSVIMSGSDRKIFNAKDKAVLKPGDKLKIVTHHWSDNWYKGFDIYTKLDAMLQTEKYKESIEFTYIGNVPENVFENTIHIQPLDGEELAKALKMNHIYITASLNEPSGNHHIEAAQCGLPILYINSGGIPEFCEGYGIMFEDENFESKLDELIDKYKFYESKMSDYPYNSDVMCREYLDLFENLVNNSSVVEKNINFVGPSKKIVYRLFWFLKKYLFRNKYSKSTISFIYRAFLKIKGIIVN